MFKLAKNIDDINLHDPIHYFYTNGRIRGHLLKNTRRIGVHKTTANKTQLATTSSLIESSWNTEPECILKSGIMEPESKY